MQLEEFESPSDIFGDYVYFSSYSTSWLEHCRIYAGHAIETLSLGSSSLVVELASNDGYLLQYFKENNIPVLGVEPAANVAAEAVARGIPTEVAFFGLNQAKKMVDRGLSADLIVANNVLAHVPDINDFVEGIAHLLRSDGSVTFEFPHLLHLIVQNQYDTIYHEHFSYLSLETVSSILNTHGLRVYDVEELTTHGGSLRVWACHAASSKEVDESVNKIIQEEHATGLRTLKTYTEFNDRVAANKRAVLRFLIEARDAGKRIAAYGAAAKGTTLLNYCGVGTDLIDYVCDRNPHKQGKFMPGCHLPVLDPKAIFATRPDYVVILPWNLRSEIANELNGIREWGGQFVVPIPSVQVF